MDEHDKYKQEYLEKISTYETLGANLCTAIKLLLDDKSLSYLSIYHRVKDKDKDTFIEKIKRKKYSKPFEEMEDLCGIRVICYFPEDALAIKEILIRELSVKESVDKEEILKADQFGYRSHHLIATVHDTWLVTPNYRNLRGFKAEIQIRTVLMHAWAEIEHKLNYKKQEHAPKEFLRKLYRLSAKLEEADEQFEDLRTARTLLQKAVEEKVGNKESIKEQDLNIDTLKAYLNAVMPDVKEPNDAHLRDLLSELKEVGISFTDIENAVSLVYDKIKGEKGFFIQFNKVGAIRRILDIANKKYFEYRFKKFPEIHEDIIKLNAKYAIKRI